MNDLSPLAPIAAGADAAAIPLIVTDAAGLEARLAALPEASAAWAKATGFEAKADSLALLPDAEGKLQAVLVGRDAADKVWALASLPGKLPAGRYRLDLPDGEVAAPALLMGWALGGYRFQRYRSKPAPERKVELVHDDAAAVEEAQRLARAVALVRDLVNIPANDLGPRALGEAALAVAKAGGAEARMLVGEELLAEGFPAIHAVGRAAAEEPRLVDFRWGPEDAPKVTLVGKGVCFDTGGLDLKPSSAMLTMKKDMGGAAHALALAQAIMEAGLRVRLRVLVAIVENSVSAGSFRPLDVLQTRKGLTVEVGNTDAEGRLILSDALTEASRENPQMLLDFATLTGAARVALGTDVPALFSNSDALAARLLQAAEAEQEGLWRLPLWPGYRRQLDSPVADLNNAPSGGYGGAITAALFLERFLEQSVPWAHFDLMAWNLSGRPGRPVGGEAMALRAVFRAIQEVAAEGAA